jgi:ATP-binding cassette subfamily C exporter for protease/lipase
LYGEPAFVVLDEPNSNLDEVGEAALLSAITRMKQKGTSFVIITHRTNVLRVIDKILLMRDGQQHLYGPRDEVLAALSGAPANNRQAVSAG